LLRCLNLLHKPSSGVVEVSQVGLLVDRRSTLRHRRQTGMVFQQHQLIGRHTALQNVLLGRIGYHGTLRSLFPLPRAERAFALECLERVGLLEKALERVDQLSGGQQQRVGIARALAQRPRLVLADEPVASLDPASAEKVLDLLRHVCKEDGITAILSLHQVALAQAYADRIIGLAHGAVVFDGVPGDLTPAYLDRLYHQGPQPAGAAAPPSTGSHKSLDFITARGSL
jgi:phosphonate transport system ATP-binding protein